jgi:hypothetical protein
VDRRLHGRLQQVEQRFGGLLRRREQRRPGRSPEPVQDTPGLLLGADNTALQARAGLSAAVAVQVEEPFDEVAQPNLRTI